MWETRCFCLQIFSQIMVYPAWEENAVKLHLLSIFSLYVVISGIVDSASRQRDNSSKHGMLPPRWFNVRSTSQLGSPILILYVDRTLPIASVISAFFAKNWDLFPRCFEHIHVFLMRMTDLIIYIAGLFVQAITSHTVSWMDAAQTAYIVESWTNQWIMWIVHWRRRRYLQCDIHDICTCQYEI